jgi:hypothetical protein
MTVTRIAWRPLGAAALLAAALVLLTGTLPARAGVVVASGTASSSSSATQNGFFGSSSASNSQTDGPHFTPLSASSSASVSDGFGSTANQSGHGSLSLTPPSAAASTLTGHLDSSGAITTNFGANNANGSNSLTGFVNLTGNYQYTLNATGTASGSSAFGDNSSASLSIPDAGISDSATAPFSGTSSFSDTRSGILGNGPHSFSASAANNTNFSSSSATLDFSLQLTPIPEPGMFALLGPSLLLVGLVFVGAAGIGWVRRRKAVAAA